MKLSSGKVSFNLGNVEVIQGHRQKILKFLEAHVDVVFGNEEELRELTGMPAEEGCLALQKKCPLVVMTREAKGCLIAQGGKLLAVPGQQAKKVDATGAGDVFASGFIFGLLQGKSLENCGLFGNLLGAAIVEVIGADLSEVSEKKKEQLGLDQFRL
jgi:sugar/nucleoside kinase (ribokinase family)